MRINFLCRAGIVGLSAASLWFADGLQAKDAPVSKASSRDADRAAILQSARDFTDVFEKGDARAVAALWTDQGEYESDDGTILRGRSAIEAAFAAHFKARPAEKMEIKVENIRFPSRDTAVEEGLTCTTAAGMLPSRHAIGSSTPARMASGGLHSAASGLPARIVWQTWIG